MAKAAPTGEGNVSYAYTLVYTLVVLSLMVLNLCVAQVCFIWGIFLCAAQVCFIWSVLVYTLPNACCSLRSQSLIDAGTAL